MEIFFSCSLLWVICYLHIVESHLNVSGIISRYGLQAQNKSALFSSTMSNSSYLETKSKQKDGMTDGVADLPSGPLDLYRKKASFNWKEMLLFIDGEDILAFKVAITVWVIWRFFFLRQVICKLNIFSMLKGYTHFLCMQCTWPSVDCRHVKSNMKWHNLCRMWLQAFPAAQ